MRYLLLILLLTNIAFATSFSDYANSCLSEVGPIPSFTCAEGVTVPITVDGKTPDSYNKNMTCDRPALLFNGSDSDGQCVPGSRIVNMSNASAQISAMCRQKKIRPKDSLDFDEIDIIAHNPKSGATCWFQASASQGQVINGQQIPSATALSSATFFNAPEAVVKDGCGVCHDNDPFMYSPFVGQVWGSVPVNPFGPYYHVDLPSLGFDNWPLTHMLPRDSTCTGCHRIGVQQTCGVLADIATGRITPPGANKLAANYPLSHSMPPFHNQTLIAWNSINKASVDTIADCCQYPNQTQCNTIEILDFLK